jgi:hypothetical protein
MIYELWCGEGIRPLFLSAGKSTGSLAGDAGRTYGREGLATMLQSKTKNGL